MSDQDARATPATANADEFLDQSRLPRSRPNSTCHRVALSETLDGTAIAVPAGLIHGTNEGPRIWIQAGLHGDEVCGVAAAHRILASGLPRLLRGTVVVVPVVNVLAFSTRSRTSPLDGQDGNRVWGVRALQPTEQHSHTIGYLSAYWDLVRSFEPTAIIDLHDGGPSFEVAPHALYVTGTEESALRARELARTSRMPYSLAVGMEGGTTFDHGARLASIPSVTLEAGGSTPPTGTTVTRLYRAVRSVLAACGTMRAKASEAASVPIAFDRTSWERASRAGLLTLLVRLGNEVHEGQLVAHVVDIFGNIVEEVPAPMAGTVFAVRRSPVVDVGDQVVKVAS